MSRMLSKMNLISTVQQLPKEDIETIQGYVEMIEEENQELKKKLEENKDKINWYENFEINKIIDKLRIKHNNQQKEFINFLEDNYKETQDIWYIKILQKYKSIIGVSDENNMEKSK